MKTGPLPDYDPDALDMLTRALTDLYQAPGEIMDWQAFEARFAAKPEMLQRAMDVNW